VLLRLVIADQSAGGLAKPAEGAGGNAETRSFPRDDFQIAWTFSRRSRRRSNEPSEPCIVCVRFMRVPSCSLHPESKHGFGETCLRIPKLPEAKALALWLLKPRKTNSVFGERHETANSFSFISFIHGLTLSLMRAERQIFTDVKA